MAKHCPGCRVWIARQAVACPRCRPRIPEAVKVDLVKLWFDGLWWSESPRWVRAHTAAVNHLIATRTPVLPRLRLTRCRGVPL